MSTIEELALERTAENLRQARERDRATRREGDPARNVSMVQATNEKISTKLEQIKTFNRVKVKLETIKKQAGGVLALTDDKYTQEEVNLVINLVENGYREIGGFQHWSSHVNERPNGWAEINYIGISEITSQVESLNRQVESLRSMLPSTEEINGAKARVTQLAMERKDVQTSTLETLESTATVLMSLVDAVITHVLPVYQELVPLEAQAKESKSRELQLQQSISEIMQRYDLARSYKFTIPVKPVLVPVELTELINLCRLIIPQLVNGDTSNLAKYEELTSSVKDLQVA